MKRKKIKEEEDEDKEGNKRRKIVVMMTDRKASFIQTDHHTIWVVYNCHYLSVAVTAGDKVNKAHNTCMYVTHYVCPK